MAAPDGTPLIEGFEDGVIPPTLRSASSWPAFLSTCPALERDLGVTAAQELSRENHVPLPRSPSAACTAASWGAEANTIIPHRSTVAIDIRMVKNQRLETVYQRVLDHIRAQGFEVIEGADAPLPDRPAGARRCAWPTRVAYDPAKTAADLPVCAEIVAAIERAHGGQQAVVMPDHGRQRAHLGVHGHPEAAHHPRARTPTPTIGSTVRTSTCGLDHLFQGVRNDRAASPGSGRGRTLVEAATSGGRRAE
jgi:acetylornithine deacetylase/succinyl-diaminopimelate desuccinylase-like protein